MFLSRSFLNCDVTESGVISVPTALTQTKSIYAFVSRGIRKKETQERLTELGTFIAGYYETARNIVKETEVKNGISATLITKILMGTLGCVPAYDRYFIDGIKDQGISTGNYNLRSLLKLVDF